MHTTAPAPSCDMSRLRDDIVTHITARRRRYNVTNADIDDLAQSALTKIVASIDTYRPERGEFRAWAFGIVHHVLCHHARNMDRYNARFSEYCHNLDEHESSEPSPERNAQREQARREFSNVIDNFKPKHWEVLTLHAIDELSHAGIGRELGMSEAASQKCYQRTRNKLAECLDDELLIGVPLVTATCQDKCSKARKSRWFSVYHMAHYTAQIASLVAVGSVALFMNSATNSMPEPVPMVVAMPQEKPAPVVSIETTMQRDEPAVKRESTPPRIRVAPARKITAPKRAFTTPLPPYNPPMSPASYRQLGR